MLTLEQVAAYGRDGFLIIENFFDEGWCDLLMSRATQLIEQFDPLQYQVIFNSKDERFVTEQYFLASAYNIHFFFEKDAFNHHGKLVADKRKAINKIGHALHDLDPIFATASRLHKIAVLTQQLSLKNALLLQSMYICKQPFIGGEVKCHQDSTYLYTEGQPVLGLWFALEDASKENGCLWAIPGAHQTLKARMMRNADNQISIETYDATPWQHEKLVPLEVPRGSLIVLHGLLPHMSYENKSAKSRHAYSLHVIDQNSHYSAKNWLQRPSKVPFRGFV